MADLEKIPNILRAMKEERCSATLEQEELSHQVLDAYDLCGRLIRYIPAKYLSVDIVSRVTVANAMGKVASEAGSASENTLKMYLDEVKSICTALKAIGEANFVVFGDDEDYGQRRYFDQQREKQLEKIHEVIDMYNKLPLDKFQIPLRDEIIRTQNAFPDETVVWEVPIEAARAKVREYKARVKACRHGLRKAELGIPVDFPRIRQELREHTELLLRLASVSFSAPEAGSDMRVVILDQASLFPRTMMSNARISAASGIHLELASNGSLVTLPGSRVNTSKEDNALNLGERRRDIINLLEDYANVHTDDEDDDDEEQAQKH